MKGELEEREYWKLNRYIITTVTQGLKEIEKYNPLSRDKASEILRVLDRLMPIECNRDAYTYLCEQNDKKDRKIIRLQKDNQALTDKIRDYTKNNSAIK